MDATDRIVEEFDRLIAMGQQNIPNRPYAEQVVYFVVATSCEIDMEGFESVYEQAFKPHELEILINGLRSLGETDMAEHFARGLQLLHDEGFYDHLNWNRVSNAAKDSIEKIGVNIGRGLCGLDEKLVALLDAQRPLSSMKEEFDV